VLTLPPSTKIFMARESVDMRRSFDGLSVAVRSLLQQDPMSGYLFIFLNRTRSIVKALYWDHGGYCMWAKRLERGRFPALPTARGGRCVELDWTDLMMLLSGIELQSVERRPVWEPGKAVSPGAAV
jgi:transposase